VIRKVIYGKMKNQKMKTFIRVKSR
jgi:hypothetical protein